MTIVDDHTIVIAPAEPTSAVRADGPNDARAAAVGTIVGAAALAGAAAGWMIAGIFAGAGARVAGLVGAPVGALAVFASYRTRRPAVVQYLTIPGALVVGAVVVLASSTREGSLPALIAESLRGGGLAQPPVAFDAGWRFIVIVSLVLLGSAAAALPIALNRPKLAVALPAPVMAVAALAQPGGAELVSTLGALALLALALTVVFGEELRRDGPSNAAFEIRRLARGAVGAIALVAALAVASQLGGGLLPKPAEDQVIPPRRPETPAASPDRVLFTVRADRPSPWRVGVLDVYEDNAWKTPPFDPGRFRALAPRVVGDKRATARVSFELAGLEGRVLPSPPAPVAIAGAAAEIDPRTDVLRRPSASANRGGSYAIVMRLPPTGDELSAAADAGSDLNPFRAVPAAPPGVRALLAQAPAGPLFARLQFVRQAFYGNVVAAGAGRPVDVSPRRVDQILAGREATPYEITAAEALLARWAGVPARVGFGYFGGQAVPGGFEVRPKNGATWLEAYFRGPGWVPLVGVPPKAKSSLDRETKNADAAVRPTDELALVTYVPVRLQTLRQTAVVVRYYAARVLLVGVAVAAAIAFLPVLLRALRRRRRRRWSDRHGAAGRIVAVYAELRDHAADLGVGTAVATPLEFASTIAADVEHHELAWLVTRVQWGDLAGPSMVGAEEADTAEALSRSVARRLRLAQPGFARVAAAASRVSLRHPYDDSLPNAPSAPSHLATTLAIAVTLFAGIVAATTVGGPDGVRPGAAALPPVPGQTNSVVWQREPKAERAFGRAGRDALVTGGRVYSVRQGTTIQGSLQLAALRADVVDHRDDIQEGVRQSIGAGRFAPTRLGGQRVFSLDLPEQHLLLWFAADGRSYQLLVARRSFRDADALFAALLETQLGQQRAATSDTGVPAPDPIRGGDA